jgi:hypothetical protein
LKKAIIELREIFNSTCLSTIFSSKDLPFLIKKQTNKNNKKQKTAAQINFSCKIAVSFEDIFT